MTGWRLGTHAVVAFAVTLWAGGCSYRLGMLDNPLERKLSWFSFLDAGDIRNSCGQGAPDRYRIVYNGRYEEQVRIYELDGASGRLEARVVGPADLSGFSLADPMGPWAGQAAAAMLSPAQVAMLDGALRQSGLGAPADQGLELASGGFWWLAAACRAGRFDYQAWAWPSPAFQGLTFGQVLAGLDPTGIAVNPPRTTGPDLGQPREGRGVRFTLRLDRDGLWGVPR